MSKFQVKKLLVITVIFGCTKVFGNSDAYYSKIWCERNGGHHQKSLPDGTRPDCTLGDAVVEVEKFDSTSKVYESLGQALHYGTVSGKIPIIVYVLEHQGQEQYLDRVKKAIAIQNLNIKTISFNENYSVAGIFQAENNSIDNVQSSNSEDEELHPRLGVSICQKVCSIGKACGNSCISRSKICHKPPGTACDSR